jgi:hypothetical protein
MATISELKNMVLQKAGIVAIIGRYVKLQRKGSEHLGLCPFHVERSPSFSVNEKKGIFKCFGCNESGDVIAFVMKHERKGFVEALEAIAAMENIQYSYEMEPKKGNGFYQPKTLKDFKAVPIDLVALTLDKYEKNPFFHFICSLVGFDEAINIMLSFFVGTTKTGGTIFWQVDQFNRVRTAQVIHYNTNGKRNKDVPPGKPVDKDGFPMFTINKGYHPCFFGEHQLFKAGKNDLIAIVESEKTAILCSIFLPELNGRKTYWIAAGGNNGITEEKAWCLSGMNVCLVPDFSWLSRATWGLTEMRRDAGGKINREGEVDTTYRSRAALLMAYGCNVSFFDPFPEVNDNTDLADELLKVAPVYALGDAEAEQPPASSAEAFGLLIAPDWDSLKIS